MFMVTMKRTSGNSYMPIPSEGIHDLNGHLFHHSSLKSMMPAGVERLREYGIHCESHRRFTKEEDALIDRNWNEFRLEHNLGNVSILDYTGFGGKPGRYCGKLQEFRRASDMWPRLCRGLESRCAKNVRDRIVFIYHRFPDRPFTAEDDIYLQQLTKRFSMAVICEVMGRSFATLRARHMWLLSRQLFSRSERRKLWNMVSVLAPCQPTTNLQDYTFPEPCEDTWTTVARSMGRCKKTLRKEWAGMVTELEALRDEGLLTFEDALDKVAPLSVWISAADLSEFIEIFAQEVPKLESLRLNQVQKKAIVRQMRTRGVSGFRTGRVSEFQFCLRRLGRMLSALRRNLLRPASLLLSLSTQLCLLSRCLRSLPGAEKNQRFVLRRNHVIEQIEKQMTSENPEWKLSRKLRRYIEGEKE